MNFKDLGYWIVCRRLIYSSITPDRFYFKEENLVILRSYDAVNLCFGFKTIIFFKKAASYLEYFIGEIGV
jgi:hypothetical protein